MSTSWGLCLLLLAISSIAQSTPSLPPSSINHPAPPAASSPVDIDNDLNKTFPLTFNTTDLDLDPNHPNLTREDRDLSLSENPTGVYLFISSIFAVIARAKRYFASFRREDRISTVLPPGSRCMPNFIDTTVLMEGQIWHDYPQDTTWGDVWDIVNMIDRVYIDLEEEHHQLHEQGVRAEGRSKGRTFVLFTIRKLPFSPPHAEPNGHGGGGVGNGDVVDLEACWGTSTGFGDRINRTTIKEPGETTLDKGGGDGAFQRVDTS